MGAVKLLRDWWPTIATIVVLHATALYSPVLAFWLSSITLAALVGFLYGVGTEIVKRRNSGGDSNA